MVLYCTYFGTRMTKGHSRHSRAFDKRQSHTTSLWLTGRCTICPSFSPAERYPFPIDTSRCVRYLGPRSQEISSESPAICEHSGVEGLGCRMARPAFGLVRGFGLPRCKLDGHGNKAVDSPTTSQKRRRMDGFVAWLRTAMLLRCKRRAPRIEVKTR